MKKDALQKAGTVYIFPKKGSLIKIRLIPLFGLTIKRHK
jgi:hypothetical protein